MKSIILMTVLFPSLLFAALNPIETTKEGYKTHYAHINGLKIAYQDIGKETDPVVFLVMGLGRHLTAWKDTFIKDLNRNGFRVIRFDNRDVGLSDKIHHKNKKIKQHMNPLYRRTGIGLPYTLKHMANDLLGLMNFLKIDKAHFAGASLGGMITQMMAIHYPHRVHSISLIMTTSGAYHLSRPSVDTMKKVFKKPDLSKGVESYLDYGVDVLTSIGSPVYQYNLEELREDLRISYFRSDEEDGKHRQLFAIMASPPRDRALKKLQIPTQVIHGTEDPLVPLDHGEHLAKIIPGARLDLINFMGHGFEDDVIEKVLEKMVPFFIEQNNLCENNLL